MLVPTMFFASALTYPIAVNFIPAYRIPADATGSGVDAAKADNESGSIQSDEKVTQKQ